MIREKKLVAPPEFALPAKGVVHKQHPLLELARLSSSQAKDQQQAGDFDVTVALETNQVVVVGQIEEGFELFAGRFVSPDVFKQSSDPEWFIQQLLKGTTLHLNRPDIRTFDGRDIPARVRGLVFPQFSQEIAGLYEDTFPGASQYTQWQNRLLADYRSPDKLAQNPKEPQIFTYSSAFNPALNDWPFSRSADFLEQLSPQGLERFANDFIFDGLGVLASETENKYVRQAAARLHELRGGNRIGVNIALDPRHTLTQEFRVPSAKAEEYTLSSYAITYLPNMDYAPANIQGLLVIPHDWFIAAGERPVAALAHLVHTASLVRDHSNGRFDGTQLEGTRWGAYQISHSEQAKKRAGSMTAQLLMEATAYDHQRYGIKLNLDAFSRDQLVKYPFGTANNHHYDDPSGGFNKDDRGPGNGPDDNFSNSPTRPSSLSGRV